MMTSVKVFQDKYVLGSFPEQGSFLLHEDH